MVYTMPDIFSVEEHEEYYKHQVLPFPDAKVFFEGNKVGYLAVFMDMLAFLYLVISSVRKSKMYV